MLKVALGNLTSKVQAIDSQFCEEKGSMEEYDRIQTASIIPKDEIITVLNDL